MPTKKKVLVVGFGTMGPIHAKKIQDLDPELLVVVDLREDRRQAAVAAGYLAYPTIAAAYAAHKNFEVVVVTTNTAEHASNIEQIIVQSIKSASPLPDLFVEKPIVANQAQSEYLSEILLKYGYDSDHLLMTGYLLRESPAVQQLLAKIKAEGANIISVDITWQKQRKADRASAGVIKDEATHSLDLVEYILRSLGLAYDASDIRIRHAIRSRAIVNQQEQDLLYPDPEDPNRNPFAEIDYSLNMGDVMVNGFSSFQAGPQERSIVFNCVVKGADKEYKLVFDDKGYDCCDNQAFLTDKIALMWQSFLAATQSQAELSHMTSMQQAFKDVLLTAELEKLAYEWPQRPAQQLHAWLEASQNKVDTATTVQKPSADFPSFNFSHKS